MKDEDAVVFRTPCGKYRKQASINCVNHALSGSHPLNLALVEGGG